MRFAIMAAMPGSAAQIAERAGKTTNTVGVHLSQLKCAGLAANSRPRSPNGVWQLTDRGRVMVARVELANGPREPEQKVAARLQSVPLYVPPDHSTRAAYFSSINPRFRSESVQHE